MPRKTYIPLQTIDYKNASGETKRVEAGTEINDMNAEYAKTFVDLGLIEPKED